MSKVNRSGVSRYAEASAPLEDASSERLQTLRKKSLVQQRRKSKEKRQEAKSTGGEGAATSHPSGEVAVRSDKTRKKRKKQKKRQREAADKAGGAEDAPSAKRVRTSEVGDDGGQSPHSDAVSEDDTADATATNQNSSLAGIASALRSALAPSKRKPSGSDEAVASPEAEDKKEADEQLGMASTAGVLAEIGPAHSLREEASAWGLDDHLVLRLEDLGVDRFFPIQREVVPTLLRAQRSDDPSVGDVCVSAPTGSGKTLVYVLPIVQSLLRRRIPRLRAVVVLPTRDLALQVRSVFRHMCEGTDLVVASALGQAPFQDQQRVLSLSEGPSECWDYGAEVPSRTKARTPDILVCTPGRLIDHLDQTKGFTLRHLRFLVVDEADRLLAQAYQGWLQRVYSAIFSPPTSDGIDRPVRSGRTWPGQEMRVGSLVPPCVSSPSSTTTRTSPWAPPLRRILLSATMTRNPQRLAQLSLRFPRLFTATQDVSELHEQAGLTLNEGIQTDPSDGRGRVAVPKGLSESLIVCRGGEKPLVLMHLLKKLAESETQVLLFTATVETTHRLTRLLQLYDPLPPDSGSIVEFSAELSQGKRSRLLELARGGFRSVSVLVSSDAAARGLDLPTVGAVLQFDPPADGRAYIHRVGRTARAGRSGQSVTLLRPKQLPAFHARLRRVGHTAPVRDHVPPRTLQRMIPRYEAALGELQALVEAEESDAFPTFEAVKPIAEPLESTAAMSDNDDEGGEKTRAKKDSDIDRNVQRGGSLETSGGVEQEKEKKEKKQKKSKNEKKEKKEKKAKKRKE